MPKKKSGDNYPTDIKGQMLFLGSIVAVARLEPVVDQDPVVRVALKLGYISKLTQKRGIDVTYFEDHPESGGYKPIIIRVSAQDVSLIEKTQLKTMDKFHEAIRMAAALAAQYD